MSKFSDAFMDLEKIKVMLTDLKLIESIQIAQQAISIIELTAVAQYEERMNISKNAD